MLTFAGLWGVCDRKGVFPAEVRYLKLDILPFIDFNMEKTLSILESAGFIMRFCADGKPWGYVVNFTKHQRITGKEAETSSKFPTPPMESAGQNRGNTGETPGKHPVAQEREEEREGKGRECAHERGNDQDDFFESVEVLNEYPPPVAAAPPPNWAQVAQEMISFFTETPEGKSQWEMMEAGAGGAADPVAVCTAWAGKAPPIQLADWRRHVGRLVTWVQQQVQSARQNEAKIKKINPNGANGHLIAADEFRRAVQLAVAAD